MKRLRQILGSTSVMIFGLTSVAYADSPVFPCVESECAASCQQIATNFGTPGGQPSKPPETGFARCLNVSVQEGGDDATCENDVRNDYVLSDTFILNSGAITFVNIKTWEHAPEYRLCVAQRPGHPGNGWASATVDATCGVPTALDVAHRVADVVSKLGPATADLALGHGDTSLANENPEAQRHGVQSRHEQALS